MPMPRVKIQFPDNTKFNTKVEITVEHINYGNHVGNQHFLTFCHESRLRFLKSIKQDEVNFFGTGLIMSDAELSYKAQVFHGDTLSIEVAVGYLNEKSFEFYYRMKNQEGSLVCLAKTGMVYYSYKRAKLESAPEGWPTYLSQITTEQ